MSTPLITCIYCRKQSEPSKEHVLQKGLGGDLTIQYACSVCNGGFSQIDQVLAECSPMALLRVGYAMPGGPPTRLGGDHFHYSPEHDLWTEVRLTAGLIPKIPPQLHFRDDKVYFYGSEASDLADFINFMDRTLANGSLEALRIVVGPPDRTTTIRVVKHRRKDAFIRAPSEESARSCLSVLGRQWGAIKSSIGNQNHQTLSYPKPSIDGRHSFLLDDINRAAAKACFNLLAYRHGPEMALRPEFDPIRDYIRGFSIVHADPLPEGCVAVDTRFVDPCWADRTQLLQGVDHALALYYCHPVLFGIAQLYGHAKFVVRLGSIEPFPEGLYIHEFTTDHSGNRPVTARELAKRCLAAATKNSSS